MRRFYAPTRNFEKVAAFLDENETRHLRDVLRLREGTEINVFDGEGREFLCEIVKLGKNRTELHITSEIPPTAPESPLDLTLAPALLKGEKFDLVVQKAVELGVRRLTPIVTYRCNIKLKDRSNKAERWQRIALEAAKQSGRARLMRIDEPIEFLSLLNMDQRGEMIMFSEREGNSFDKVRTEKDIVAVTGAEGGWEDTEIKAARDAGAAIVTLGGRILRAETAPIAIVAILQHRFGDIK
ncbi:MAG TPA: 16S rRNA (uracil(1498)-N(3))-methyltransferase [Pyrinomonadaceae bacterium]|nr:16S rRNA (uracil(1498)-N(3))-methyltransferase [Pyrinomonadaceae bacterium]